MLLIFKAEIDRRQNEYEKLGSLIGNGQIFLNYLAQCILGNEKNIIVYCYFLQYLKPTLIISRVGLYYNTYVVHCTYVCTSGAMKDEFLAQVKNCTWDSSNMCRGYGMNDKTVTFGQFHC